MAISMKPLLVYFLLFCYVSNLCWQFNFDAVTKYTTSFPGHAVFFENEVTKYKHIDRTHVDGIAE